jgi:hypothetical protein
MELIMYEDNVISIVKEHDQISRSYKNLGIPTDILYELVATESKIGSWRLSILNKELFWSDEMFELHGFKKIESAINFDSMLNMYNKEDARLLSDLVNSAILIKAGFRIVLRMARPGLSVRLFEMVARIMEDENGNVESIYGIIRDVTSATELDNVNKNQSSLINNIVNKMPSAIAVVDKNMNYVAASDRWLSDYNIKGNIIGCHYYDIFPDAPLHWRDLYELALQGTCVSRDLDVFERANGVKIILNWSLVPWHDRRGEIGGVAILTEVKQVIPASRDADVRAPRQPILTTDFSRRFAAAGNA